MPVTAKNQQKQSALKNMTTIDLSNWRFSFGGSLPQFDRTNHYKAPEIIEIKTPIELLLRLADDDAHDSGFQGHIQERLKNDSAAKKWHSQRTRIGGTTHFKLYRKNPHYDLYHAAARAIAAGSATREQQSLVCGLDGEIAASQVLVPPGQVLFHGRGDLNLHTSPPYPSFVSTSLDPVVCIYHAVKRRLQKDSSAKAVIYALTLRDPLPALWGNGGGLKEWELLLQTKLTCSAIKTHPGTRFDIVEATIGY
ncbi:hypothetical protein SAMN05443579_101220 [Variovorax sp. PDC80]|nr:hypothetical protein SAMN05443579_101220 [Variovorax sp. PDC80]